MLAIHGQPPTLDPLPPPSVLKRISKYHLQRVCSQQQLSNALNTPPIMSVADLLNQVSAYSAQQSSPHLLSVPHSILLELNGGNSTCSRTSSFDDGGEMSLSSDSVARNETTATPPEPSCLPMISTMEPTVSLAGSLSVKCDIVISPSPTPPLPATLGSEQHYPEKLGDMQDGDDLQNDGGAEDGCLVCCEGAADAVPPLTTPCTARPNLLCHVGYVTHQVYPKSLIPCLQGCILISSRRC
jgi:hypothetical protein